MRFVACLTAMLLLASLPALTEEPDGSSGEGPAQVRDIAPGDKVVGEKVQLQKRREWFWSSRTAGVESRRQAARMRLLGVQQTREMLERQVLRRSFGTDGLDNWEPMGPEPSRFGGWAFGDISGRVTALAADTAGGTLYLGAAAGGLWKSTDDGVSWQAIFDQAGTQTIGAVTVDPNDPQTLWAGTGDYIESCEGYFGIGLMRSTDGGVSWEPRNGSGSSTLEDLSNFSSVVVDPRNSDHLLVGGRIRGCTGDGSSTTGGLFTSDDGGATWTERLTASIYEIQQDPSVFDTYWASTNQGIYKSTDNGQSWIQQTASGLPTGSTGRTELAIAPSDGNTVYALFDSGNSGDEFWRTTDGGASWSLMSSGGDACDGQCWYNAVVRVHISDPDTVYRGSIRIYKSEDGGATWADLSNPWGSSQKVHQDMHVLLMDPSDPNKVWAGGDGGLWLTDDGGANFSNRNGNLGITQFYAIDVHPTNTDIICGGAQDNSSLARGGADNVWDLQVATGDGFVCQFNTQDTDIVFATSYPGFLPNIYRSTSGLFGGYSIVTGFGSGIQLFDRINWVTPYLLDPTNPSTLYLGTHRVYRSENNGSSWTQVGPADLTGGSGNLRALAINRGHPDVLYSGSQSGRIWRTDNRGDNWLDITAGLPGGRQITDVAGDPDDADRALATVGGFNTDHLWEWTAASGVWSPVGNGLPNVPANTVVFRDGGDVFVGTDTGVFRSTDGGANFSPYMNDLPQGMVVTDLKYNVAAEVLTLGSYSRGAWQTTVGNAGGGGNPGEVENTLLLHRAGPDIQASWDVSCNDASTPGQTYSIQSGSLASLRSGAYDHSPVDDACSLTSPATFTPFAGDRYYLVVPNSGGSEGGAGVDSGGVSRPQPDATCGVRQVAACP
ncbi:hypothetical protein ABI59_08420 [Acidobacteria bacterium Mor1]|nr:hypothetical protein ABI59_08420 [Acidobacteria bacterium Mor1]